MAARNYKELTRGPGMFVPRWLIILVVGAGMVYFVARILVPPSFIVKRLRSPDGERAAQLMRTQHGRQHFTVHVKDGWFWRSVYTSGAITNDDRIDLGERFIWSEDGNRVFLEVKGEQVWGYDFTTRRSVYRAVP